MKIKTINKCNYYKLNLIPTLKMEMPIVDNEFLDLFLPESLEVNSNDLIEEFKFYIFRIMNLSVEDLMQEQVYIIP